MNKILLKKVVIILVLLLISNISMSMAKEIEEPLDLIEVFYNDLLSNKPINECAEIFMSPEAVVSTIPKIEINDAPNKLTATSKLWYYLRKHKDVFLFPGIPAEEIGKRGITYTFSVFDRRQFIFDGYIGIMLGYPLQKNGVRKQIIFLIEKTRKPYGPRYLINTAAITINGIPFDISDNSLQELDIYKELGFR